MEEGVERGVEIFAALQCLVIGLSYIAQPRAWVEMFLWLKSRGPIIVAFHNVWTGTAAVVTAFGWGLALHKGLFTVLVPQVSLRGLDR